MHTRGVMGTFLSLGSCLSKTSGFSVVQYSYRTTSQSSSAAAARRTSTTATAKASLGPNLSAALGEPSLRRYGRSLAAAVTTAAYLPRAAGRVTRRASSAMLAVGLLSSSSRLARSVESAASFGWTHKNTRLHGTPSVAASMSGTAADSAAMKTAAVEGGAPGLQNIKPSVIFVLGGPGSGKGTQCERLVNEYGYVHLSAGELLRQERASGSSDGQLIDEYIREGRIVPVAISLGLLRKAMDASGPFSRFLIDGFPRNADNLQGWDAIMGDAADVRCVLFLHCPEDVLEKRLLSRGKNSGRTDDNAETAKRRFQTYVETTLPVVEGYERQGMVACVNGNQDIDSVFRDVILGLKPVQEKEVLDANRLAVEAACSGDWSTYAELCTSDITELLGGGLALAPSSGKTTSSSSSSVKSDTSDGAQSSGSLLLSRLEVRMLGGRAAVTSCERPFGPGLVYGGDGSDPSRVLETRVWELQGGRWKCSHCHISPLVGGGIQR